MCFILYNVVIFLFKHFSSHITSNLRKTGLNVVALVNKFKTLLAIIGKQVRMACECKSMNRLLYILIDV